MRVSGRRIIEIRSALQTLMQRMLPDIASELRVARIAGLMAPAFAEYEHVRRKLSVTDKNVDALDELLEADFEIPDNLPRLGPSNLPKKLSGDTGDMNRFGLAGVIAGLTPEIFDMPEDA